jgi:23S rRNA (guanosine2251-2'-O)-methyltransferase
MREEPARQDPSTEQGSVVFGVHAVTELLRVRPSSIERIYFLQGRTTGPVFSLLKEARKARLPYQVVPETRLDKVAPGARHQGVVAVCAARPYDDAGEVLDRLLRLDHAGLVLVPASVEDPRNLGSLIRSAVAFGVDAMLLERGNTAPLTEAVAKSAVGMLEYATVARPRSLEAAVQQLRDSGYAVIGAAARAPKLPSEATFTGPCVLVVGGEHRGIPPYLAKLCDVTVGIPLDPRVDSLNVAAAVSVLLYECKRQRLSATHQN